MKVALAAAVVRIKTEPLTSKARDEVAEEDTERIEGVVYLCREIITFSRV